MQLTLEEKIDKFKKRPLSWSSISSFTFNKSNAKDEWYNNYILDHKEPPSEEMKYGSKIGKMMELDSNFLPEIPRYGKDEYKFSVKYNGIKLVGYADSFNHITCKQLGERKTGKHGAYEWSQKKCNDIFLGGQLTMYCFMNYIQNKVKPEDVEIVLSWIPTDKHEDENFKVSIDRVGDIQHFKTKRKMQDIIEFGLYINKVYKQMEEFIKEKHLLSCEEIV
jgi:hypothetical protein